MLMGRFRAAAEAAEAALSPAAGLHGASLNRILCVLIQAMMKCHKSDDLSICLDRLPFVPLEPFLLWQLSLIDMGKADEARGRIEARIAAMLPSDQEGSAAEQKALQRCLSQATRNSPSTQPTLNSCFTMTGSFNGDINQPSQAVGSSAQSSRSGVFDGARQWVELLLRWLPVLISSQRQVLISIASALFLFSLAAERRALTNALKQWWRQIRALIIKLFT